MHDYIRSSCSSSFRPTLKLKFAFQIQIDDALPAPGLRGGQGVMSMLRGKAISKYAVIAVACAISMLAFEATRALAANTGNFGGDYKIIKVADQGGNNGAVKVSLRVINNSGADVKDATITLGSTLHPMPEPTEAWEKNQTPIRVVILRFNEHKIVPPIVSTFTIPKAEYEQWSVKGSSGPNFTINYQDASGQQRHDRLELAPL